jgi:hypothetical protein
MHSTPTSKLRHKENPKMKDVHLGFKTFSVVILILTFASLAHAQTRTWVSGVGDDTNPCTRMAPCKTFAGAKSKTAAGGEIDALDPGDYGVVTIDRAITIDGTMGAGFASISLSSGTGITVNAAATDVVTLRNLSINGNNGSGANGIFIGGAGTVHIENCVVFGTNGSGIVDRRGGNVNDVFYLYIKDTISTNSVVGDGISLVPPSAGVFLIAALTNVRSQDNSAAGVNITRGVYASLDHCIVSGNRSDGLFANGNSGGSEGTANASSMTVTNSVSSGNGNGISAHVGSTIRISGVQVFNNTLGLNKAGGLINSYGTNEIDGNTTDGAPSNTIPRK